MKKYMTHRIMCFITAAATLLLLAGAVRAGAGPKLIVVVAKGSPIKDISKSELKRLFMGDNVVVEGKKLVPFNLARGTPERDGFDKCVLGMTGEVVQRFWVDRKIRGQSEAPRSLPSSAIVLKVITKFPGAIAYIPEQDITADVQAVTVDGVGHKQPAYWIFE